RFSRRMRDEWKAGEAEVGQPLEPEPKPPAAPKPDRAPLSERWWEVLHVGPVASKDEIRRAWRRLIKENHPDKFAHVSPELQATIEGVAKRLNDAYEKAMKSR
ncbi:MAG: J domain-containing protein, partial [Verrucomicrobiaceae bacterium]